MKKLVSVVTSVCLAFSLMLFTLNDEGQAAKERYVLHENGMIHDTESGAYIPSYFTTDENGNFIELSLEEAVVELNKDYKDRQKVLKERRKHLKKSTKNDPNQGEFSTFHWHWPPPEYVYEVDANSPYTYYDWAEKLTTTFYCYDDPGVTECQKSFSFGMSGSASYTTSLSGSAFDAFEAGISFTLEESASVQDTSTVTIEPGYKVYIAGEAHHNYENGKVIEYTDGVETDRWYTYADSPIVLSSRSFLK